MFGLFSPSIERKRAKAAASARGALAEYYRTPVQPDSTPASALRLLAIDIETTGLDPRKDTVLSLGYVPVDGETIVFSGAKHRILAAGTEVGQSAVFHGITDDQVAQGVPVADAVAEALSALAGRVMLAHFAMIETRFLSRICEQLYGAPLVVPVIDTLVLHDRLINRGFDDEAKAGELRLWNARRRYGLPRYPAHGALTDALACAELYLGHLAEVSEGHSQTLKSLKS
ncbi:MAG: exonuclease domain-containing protein [Propioniciclava sp.]|uniref:exonuclease domain-containing protein n=1 Tax=Propioniciclava sp. TaxID=2038686 RepID=UPI0039E4F813